MFLVDQLVAKVHNVTISKKNTDTLISLLVIFSEMKLKKAQLKD